MRYIKILLTIILILISIKVKERKERKISDSDTIMYIEKVSDIIIPDYIEDKYVIFIYHTANHLNIPISIAFRLIHTESRFKYRALSSKGAFGLMQIMPITYKSQLKKIKQLDHLDHVEKNIFIGLFYLRSRYDKYGSWKDALIAYNGGDTYLTNKNKKLTSGIIEFYTFILE